VPADVLPQLRHPQPRDRDGPPCRQHVHGLREDANMGVAMGRPGIR
jgi:hypothetical protein